MILARKIVRYLDQHELYYRPMTGEDKSKEFLNVTAELEEELKDAGYPE